MKFMTLKSYKKFAGLKKFGGLAFWTSQRYRNLASMKEKEYYNNFQWHIMMPFSMSSNQLVCLEVIRHYGGGEIGGGSVSEFSHHNIISPIVHHYRTKRHISNTREKDGHVHDITLGFIIDNKNVLVDLQLNRDLLPTNYFQKFVKNGSHYVQRPTPEDADLCHYQGEIRGVPGSWAALSTCNGISGVVFDGSELHYVERVPHHPPEITSPHYLFKHSNVLPRNLSCGYSGKPHPVRDLFHDETFTRLLRYKRSSSSSDSNNIRGPYSANSLSRYVELVLVADNTEYEKHGHEVSKIYQRCKDIANIVNALYRPLNIFIGLVGVEVWKDEDQVEISTDGDKTLTNFLNYRKVRLIQEHPNDNAQLLTGKQFTAGVVGKALKGPICTYQYSGGVNMDHSTTVGLVATTVAHEMGHNFGMEHDTEEECECEDKRCIMAPSSGSKSPTHWSSCSYEYLALSFERSMDYCLRNKPTSLFDSPVCGNGFVEPGEQCDCGLPEYCQNSCCNASTCMLHPNATCATGHCCDLQTCGPKQAGVECRSATHECDLPEYCTGDSEYCPENVFKEEGAECMYGRAYCSGGQCRTHEEQCKLLWGPTGESSDDRCYMMNVQGNHNGNCGYNWVNDTYYKCTNTNVKCGMLHCKHLNERLEFGMESVSKVSHSFLKSNKRIIPCRVALVDMGLDMVDPGLAPNGAKCGRGKMCIDQTCLPVADLKAPGCNCNGRGTCNNLGHCHCELGFAPPDCLYPGLGGSQDSGPPSNPHATNNFVVGLFVFFLGIVPCVVLVLCLIYYTRGNLKLWWETKGRPATSKKIYFAGSKSFANNCSCPIGLRVNKMTPHIDTVRVGGVISPLKKIRSWSCSSKNNNVFLGWSYKSVADGIMHSNVNHLNWEFIGGVIEISFATAKIRSQRFLAGVLGNEIIKNTSEMCPPTQVAKVDPGKTLSRAPSLVVGKDKIQDTKHILLTHVWKKSVNNKNFSCVEGGGANSTICKGIKMSISGPCLQGSTNPAVAPVRSAPPPPPTAPPPNTAPPPPPTFPPTIVHPTTVVPLRKAPTFPSRPLSVPDASTLIAQANNQQPTDVRIKLEEDKPSTVSRIAYFLSKKDKLQQQSQAPQQTVIEVPEIKETEVGGSNTLPRKAAKIKRESLKQLEISSPMQLHATELPANLVPVRNAPDPPMPANLKPSEVKASQDDSSKPNKVSWAPSVPEDNINLQNEVRSNIRVTWTPAAKDNSETDSAQSELIRIGSMRETPVTIRPVIPKFGSMRAPRPKSLPPCRPSDPPPRPPLPMIPGTPESEYYYDDCLNIVEGTAPIADEELSPTESIYATIDENPVKGSPSKQEVTYAPNDSEEKKEKKSIFSFFNKPKKKKEKDKDQLENVVISEPIYTNLVESPPEEVEHTYSNVESVHNNLKSRAPSLSPPDTSSPPSPLIRDRTSCGSSDDGGLLSEIVSELSTRDDNFVSTLAKKKKNSLVNDRVETVNEVSKEKSSINPEPVKALAKPSEKNESSAGMTKSKSYPWRVKKDTPKTSKASGSLVTSPSGVDNTSVTSTFTLPTTSTATTSGPTPRGVFSYLGKSKPSTSSITHPTSTITTTTSATSAPITSTVKPPNTSSLWGNSRGTTSNSGPTAFSKTLTSASSLEASLAAVRAAGAAAGEAAAAANVAGSTALTGSTSSSKPTSQSSSNTGSTLKNVPQTVGYKRPGTTATTTTMTTTSVTTTTSSNKPITSAATSKSRPNFPPDKILFPPDKMLNSSSSTISKDSEIGTHKTSSKEAPGKTSNITSSSDKPKSKGPSPASSVTSTSGFKPSKLSTSRGTTPARNTPATSSGRGSDKSRSTTPQSSKDGKKTPTTPTEKSETKTAKPNDKGIKKSTDKVNKVPSKSGISKPSDKTQTKTEDSKKGSVAGGASKKPVAKSLSASTGAGVTKKTGPSRVPSRISNSHVASLQQKFENKDPEEQTKPTTGKTTTARKSQEVKPVLAPKPK
ncbi:unnamed protein product, partial [Meganyctiphanes norvegica]